jgi:hypothetical protein
MTARAVLIAVSEAALSAGDASGNCDNARDAAQRGDLTSAARDLEWAEENARAALRLIQEARAAVGKAEGGAP